MKAKNDHLRLDSPYADRQGAHFLDLKHCILGENGAWQHLETELRGTQKVSESARNVSAHVQIDHHPLALARHEPLPIPLPTRPSFPVFCFASVRL